MQGIRHRVWPLMLATMLISLSPLAGQSPSRFTIQPGSKLWMTGSSNVHNWTVEASELDGFVEVALSSTGTRLQGISLSSGVTDDLPRVEVFVPVAGLKSGHKIMDRKMATALMAKSQPVIHYELLEANFVELRPGEYSPLDLWILGKLEVAETEMFIETLVTVQFLGDGQLRVTGVLDLKMSDFGIEAPRALAGLLVTYDDIEIHFSLRLAVDPGLALLLRQTWALAAPD